MLRELALVPVDGTVPLSESSLYRFLKKQGLTKRQLLAKSGYKKCEAEYANQIWQSDLLSNLAVDLRQEPNMGNLYVRIRAGVLSDPHRYRDLGRYDESAGSVTHYAGILLPLLIAD